MRVLNIKQDFPTFRKPKANDRRPGRFVNLQIENSVSLGIETEIMSPYPWVPNILKNFSQIKDFNNDKASNSFLGSNIISFPYLNLPPKIRRGQLYSLQIKLVKDKMIQYLNFLNNRSKIDIIHSHFGQWGLASLGIKNELGIPMVTTFYGHDIAIPKLCNNFYKSLIEDGSLCIAISESMKNELTRLGFQNVVVCYLGIDTSEFIPKRSKLKDKFKFITVARFEEKKGIEYAIKAFSLVSRFNRNTEFDILGSGKLESKYRKLVKNLGIVEKVNFINNLRTSDPRGTIIQHLNSSDVFVLPSITSINGDKEGTPIVLMEAQSCGLPCISTYHAGIPEVVIDDKTGWLVNEKDYKSLAKVMLTSMNCSNKLSDFGENARKHIINNFNIDIQKTKLAEIYRSVKQ